MNRVVFGLVGLFILLTPIVPVYAEGVADGLAVGLTPPQASAETLLELPKVYALPGSTWYWMKHLWEDVQLLITVDEEQRADLLLRFGQERLAEGYQALQSGQAEKALVSLSRYQTQQQDLATSLDQMGQQDVQLNPFLLRLKEQLGIQQALEDYAKSQLKSEDQKDKVSLLLKVQPIQMLVFETSNKQYLLGAQSRKSIPQASESAQASASASPAAQLTEEERLQ